jgi:hypothetical protein
MGISAKQETYPAVEDSMTNPKAGLHPKTAVSRSLPMKDRDADETSRLPKNDTASRLKG